MSTSEKVWRQWEVKCPNCNRWHSNTITGCANCNHYLALVERFTVRLRYLRCTACLIDSPALTCPKCQATIPAKIISGLDDLPVKDKADSGGPGVLGCIVWLFLAGLVLTYCHHREPTRPPSASPTPSAAKHSVSVTLPTTR